VASHTRTTSVLTLKNFFLNHGLCESSMHILSFQRRPMHIVQMPVRRLAYDWSAVIMAQLIQINVLFASTFESPLPYFMEHDAETARIG
jgi:hypothetical protein